MIKKVKNFKFIICGTDTDIGKTLISSFLVRGLNAFYWKPIQSGIGTETDSELVYKLSKVNPKNILKEAYIFNDPVSPHWAAEIDQNPIKREELNIPKVNDHFILETAGGLMVPLTRNFLRTQAKIPNVANKINTLYRFLGLVRKRTFFWSFLILNIFIICL